MFKLLFKFFQPNRKKNFVYKLIKIDQEFYLAFSFVLLLKKFYIKYFHETVVIW